ncbi:SMR family transporter, partial [Nonomuraea sp. NPDC001023]|uniref:DMT family transporter n=1 Tax=Nonomuraea sp. NPDC001023 TaxID=3154770 RepID=UPI003325F544
KTLDVGVGYTVWTGIGSVGTVLLGSVIFGEELTVWKGLAFVLIIGGVLGLKLADRLSAKPTAEPAAGPASGSATGSAATKPAAV